MAQVRRRCRFFNGIDVDAIGRSGELSISWKRNCDVTLQSYSQRHIDVIINDDSEGKQWRCTVFYGAPEGQNRDATWNLLRQLMTYLICHGWSLAIVMRLRILTKKRDTHKMIDK
ncbi:hypothetical protein HRI_004722500 [Hibiscus trionum]|uniref:Uncharacterized protein n=1 Tax=Hibiscus trionum TaxID=183268 RepID=A0A9W7J9F4_HIBTR|nr:hypothetical protein HRI_004722500 [Hibiscus trionum]